MKLFTATGSRMMPVAGPRKPRQTIGNNPAPSGVPASIEALAAALLGRGAREAWGSPRDAGPRRARRNGHALGATTTDAIQRAFEDVGVVFLPQDDVQLRSDVQAAR